MFRGFAIWCRLSSSVKKIILLLCFIAEIPISIFCAHKISASYLNAYMESSNIWGIFLLVLSVFVVGGMLFHMAEKSTENFSLLGYWTALSHFECYAYVVCDMIPWMELGLFLTLIFGTYGPMSPVTIILLAMIADCLFIFAGYRWARRKEVRGTIGRYSEERKPYIIRRPFVQLLWVMLHQRLRCMEVTAVTILMDAAFIVLCPFVQGNTLFVIGVVFALFILLLEDRYFENEGINFAYYRSIGISLKKYLLVQICASVIYSEGIVMIISLMSNLGFARSSCLLLILLWFSLYWNLSFVYIESNESWDRVAKFWFEIMCFCISILPIANVIWIIRIYTKMKKGWGYDRTETCHKTI